MRIWSGLAALIALPLVGACAAVIVPVPVAAPVPVVVPLGSAPARAAGDPARCVALFGEFDRLERLHADNTRRGGQIAPSPLRTQGQRLREAGCLTRSADLAGLDAPGGPIAAGGRAIAPTSLHVGAVPSMEDDARVQAYFEARGLEARSVGSSVLGRRIYVGPLATEGGLDAAAAAARQIGFVAPYPAFF